MKTKLIFFSLFLVILLVPTYGQRYCGSSIDLEEIQQTDTARYQRIMRLEKQIQAYIDSAQTSGTSQKQQTIIIPVVVHVVYKYHAENVSDGLINSQIQVLNEDFQRLNADGVNTPAAFSGVASGSNIVFKLAKIDPNGNDTNGITRTITTKDGFSHITNDVKRNSTGGCSSWNSWGEHRYLNIWVCNFTDPYLMGYATFPSELKDYPHLDGVVISHKYFGRNSSMPAPYNKGRTTTHEVGHWLSLLHIWGTDNNCTSSDLVADTPNQYTSTMGCPSFPKTDICTPTSPGIMFMNFMDYTDDACMNMFTAGQVLRMNAVLDPKTGERKQILEKAEYLTTPCTTTNFANQTVNSNQTVSGCDIKVQNVTVSNNSKLIINAQRNITINGPFEVQLGSQLEVKNSNLKANRE